MSLQRYDSFLKVALLMCIAASSSRVTASLFHRPTKKAPHSLVPSLVFNDLSVDGSIQDDLAISMRVSKDEPVVCEKELFPIGRTMTIAFNFEGPEDELTYIDTNFAFFKFALGWDEEQIEESRLNEIKLYKEKFGIDATRAVLNKTTGLYVTPNGRISYGPVVYNDRFAKVADSDKLVPCTNVTAVVGGWVLFGNNLAYQGKYVGEGKRVRIPGLSFVFTMYIVFAPGSRFSTKIECRTSLPYGCILGACPVTGTTEIVDDFHEPVRGNFDGIFLQTPDDDGYVSVVTKLVLTWPARE